MRVAWLSDIHLDFLDKAENAEFLKHIASADADALLISGDVAVASNVWRHLVALHEAIRGPIYFVLGNHDFYGSSIEDVTRNIADRARAFPEIVHLNNAGVQPLTQRTCLIGHDSWADGRLGNFADSDVILNDYFLVKEVTGLDSVSLKAKLAELGNRAAACIEESLSRASDAFAEIVVATHVPPFREACWHQGRISDDNYLPHFACKAVGEVLRRFAAANPACNLTVFCGHTHGAGVARILANLTVFTAGAVYGHPCIQRTLDLA